MEAREVLAKRIKSEIEQAIELAIATGELKTSVNNIPRHTIGFIEEDLETLRQLGYRISMNDPAHTNYVSIYIDWYAR